jgi:hypothetical protein
MTAYWASLKELFVETDDIDSVLYGMNMRWEHQRKLVKKQVDKMLVSWKPLVGKTVSRSVNSLWQYCSYYKSQESLLQWQETIIKARTHKD